jgi:hypothetical protein
MIRIGAAALIILLLVALFGCDKTTDTEPTGLNIHFANCLTFETWVWIDEDYIGSYSSDVPSFIEYKSGSFTVYAKSNLIAGDTCFCWTKNVSINDGSTTDLLLDCAGAGCCKSAESAVSR